VDLLHQISTKARPQRVLAAITTEPGIRSWWTAGCNMVWGELMHRLRSYAEGVPEEPRFKG